MSISDTCKQKLNTICQTQTDDGPLECARCFFMNAKDVTSACSPLNGNNLKAVAEEVIKICGEGPDGCYNTLDNYCHSARRADPGNCLVCAGMHQTQTQEAGCNNPMIDWWCHEPPNPDNARVCDRFLRMFVTDKLPYAQCLTAAKSETASQSNVYCQGRDLGAWCRNNSTDHCPDPAFCKDKQAGFAGTCETCLNDGNPSTCGNGVPCRSTKKPPGCNVNKCPSFDCEHKSDNPTLPGDCCGMELNTSGPGGDMGKYGTLKACQEDNTTCKGKSPCPRPATPAKPVVEGYGGGGGAGPPSLRASVKPWYTSDTPTIGVL